MDTGNELASIFSEMALQQKASEALRIPEIVSDVFDHLAHNRKLLQKVASVNRIWFDEATRLLWKASSSTVLLAVEDSRRNIYAPKIRKLIVHHASCHARLRHCNLSSLRALSFASGAQIIEQGTYSQYMQPTLEKVTFMTLPPDNFLRQLNERCPQLQVFVLQSLPSVQNRSDLAGFLTDNQSLRCVKVVSESEDDSSTMFRALSKIPCLEYLTVTGETFESALEELSRLTSDNVDCPTFKTLRRLEITVGCPALSLLRPTFSAMTSLTLDILIETENHELDVLAHLPLESLQLHIATGVRFISRELLFLSNAKNLQSLTIRPKPWSSTITMPRLELSNDHFRQGFAKLSELKRLLIWFSISIRDPDTALIDLGQSCPKLENLRLYCSINLTTWELIPAPLFPNLTFAWIASVGEQWLTEDPNESIAQALAVLVDQHAPKLNRFVALLSYAFRPTETNELSKMVMRAHGRIKETSQTRHSQHDNDR